MNTKTQQKPPPRNPSHPIYLNEGMSPKKTALIIVTVIGCIAILWPKVFYPMMFGATAPKPNIKEPQRGPGGCCDVVLDREQFMNGSTAIEYGPHLYRKQLNLYTGELSIRQERPAHLHPESIYQAMRERGRAIPTTTVPIVDRKLSPNSPPPRIIDGRPGPVPGMRPPMGAGALHQPQSKGGSMGFVMPLYTIGIIAFFGYTIMKIVFKKPIPNAPYGPIPTDTNFRKDVFGHENGSQVEDLNGTKLVVTAIQGLIDAADEQLKIQEENIATADTELNKNTNENSILKNVENISNGHTKIIQDGQIKEENIETAADTEQEITIKKDAMQQQQQQQRKRRDLSAEREMTVLGMEVTASCEGGQKWTGRPPTPVLHSHVDNSKLEDNMPEPQSIYLEGTLGHESKILVADSQTKREEVYDAELNGSPEEPAVILSSKMTLSLINLDANLISDKVENEIESPLADDIEIIGHDEQ